jgi:hypothetical protein
MLKETAAGLLRSVRSWLFIALDSLCLMIPVRRRNVAITIRLDAVGDFFIWLQSGAADIAIFARQSGRRSIIVANSAWSDYARFVGLWDDVIDVDPGKFMINIAYRLRILWKIRSLGAQLLIQPRAARVFLQEDELARTSGAAFRIGNAGTNVNTRSLFRVIGRGCYDRLVGVNQDRNVHETVRNDEFVRALTGKPSSRFDLRGLHRISEDAGVAVAPGAGQSGRVWPIEKFAEVILHIKKTRPSWPVALLGAQSDSLLATRAQELIGDSARNMVGKTTLREFADTIAAANVVICNDSSAFHIAMALQKKVICFLGGGHFGWFAPYPDQHPAASSARVLVVPMDCFWCNWACKYPRSADGAYRCVASISVRAAIESLESILESSKLSEGTPGATHESW